MRTRRQKTLGPRGPRSILFKAGVGATGIGIALLVMALLVSRVPIDHSRRTARGAILDARIVEAGAAEGWPRGRILYRIEALVRFTADGETQERWLPVIYPYPREYMERWLAHRPESCEVVWAARHPENAKCRLYDEFR